MEIVWLNDNFQEAKYRNLNIILSGKRGLK